MLWLPSWQAFSNSGPVARAIGKVTVQGAANDSVSCAVNS